jgi:ubiquinone/menaquinone biosynthesis C-methylase UbiE
MTAEPEHDQWAEWLLRRRHGFDAARLKELLPKLRRIRDDVLEKAHVVEGDVLLDVGAGDGLIAFGALPLVGPTGRIIYSDISQDLLDHGRALAAEMGALDQIEFLRASAGDLSAIPDASVNVVTARSVLIYADNKRAAFSEFARVLRPGGRLSIWEPINRFAYPEPAHRFMGLDVAPIQEIAGKVRALFAELQPTATDPMLNFDERDLLALAELAGFAEVHLDLRAKIAPAEPTRWEVAWRSAGNPKIPSLEEAVTQTLTAAEAERFITYIRPRVEAGQRVDRSAVAHLWAVKSPEAS